MSANKEIFLQDIKERVFTLLQDLETWVITDPDMDLVMELVAQLYDEVNSLVEE